jgi:hypothetical protein
LFGLPASGQGVLAFAVNAAQVIEGAEEGAVEGGNLGEDLLQEFGSGRIAEDGDVEVFGGGAFGEEGPVEFGLGALETALLPIAANEGVDVEFFEGGLGVELLAVAGGEAFVFRQDLRRG